MWAFSLNVWPPKVRVASKTASPYRNPRSRIDIPTSFSGSKAPLKNTMGSLGLHHPANPAVSHLRMGDKLPQFSIRLLAPQSAGNWVTVQT